ncbi:unnamed protein product [Chironomus riparius]|uniref:Uncharacterized protein n=1 Tax=Chironomus riparius TaxID=315576 RepID=A0A9N9RUL5_9DIPT|nr:unnamed protein product [Chironomus riparius]
MYLKILIAVLTVSIIDAKVVYFHPKTVNNDINLNVTNDNGNELKLSDGIKPSSLNVEDTEDQRYKPRPPMPRPGSASSIFSAKIIAIMMPIVLINIFIKF